MKVSSGVWAAWPTTECCLVIQEKRARHRADDPKVIDLAIRQGVDPRHLGPDEARAFVFSIKKLIGRMTR